MVTEIIAGLENPSAYNHPTASIQRIITGVSVVFLTGEVAYKFNKPLNLGFLDFSSLEKRKDQCEKEVKYNSLISPELYLGVVAVTKDQKGKISINGPGQTIEYAVKMKQIKPNATMDTLLQKNQVTEQNIKMIAAKIHDFHQKALTDEETSLFGKVESIQFNWDENFQQTTKYENTFLSSWDARVIQDKVNDFIQQNKALFEKRVQARKIKHCHGDFHSANVFVTPKEIYIFDGIVFNKRFPCSDVIAEIAFMAMDLDFQGRKELAEVFVQEYQKLSSDRDIPTLLNFYKCYRAYIRGKINCFTSEDTNLTPEEKEKGSVNGKKYFTLAKHYAELL